MVVLKPWGFTVPLSLAEWLAIEVAGFVMTTGRPVGGSVVTLTTLELPLVPFPLYARTR